MRPPLGFFEVLLCWRINNISRASQGAFNFLKNLFWTRVNYDSFFSTARRFAFDFEFLETTRIEPIFTFLTWLSASFTKNNLLIYSFFVCLSLWVKGIAVSQVRNSWPVMFFVALFYGARFFPLLEMTQIRAALSSSFLLLAMKYSLTRHKKKSIFFSAISMGFHMSSSIAIPFVFLKKTPRRSYIFLISLGVECQDIVD